MRVVVVETINCQIQVIDFETEQYQEAVALRYAILRKPLGLNFSPADLACDKNEHILTATTENKVIGVLHLRHIEGNAYKLRQMAVAKDFQKSGIGSQLLTFAIVFSKEQGKTKITLHARQTAIPFYQKKGFVVVGEIFEEVDIPHCKMKLHL